MKPSANAFNLGSSFLNLLTRSFLIIDDPVRIKLSIFKYISWFLQKKSILSFGGINLGLISKKSFLVFIITASPQIRPQ